MPIASMAALIVPIFIVVFVCTVKALEQTGFREFKYVLAPAVSMLCILGLLRGSQTTESKVDVVLIPYEALAYFLIFVVILWLLARFSLWVRKVHASWCYQAEMERREYRHRVPTVEEKERPEPIAAERQGLAAFDRTTHFEKRTQHSSRPSME